MQKKKGNSSKCASVLLYNIPGKFQIAIRNNFEEKRMKMFRVMKRTGYFEGYKACYNP